MIATIKVFADSEAPTTLRLDPSGPALFSDDSGILASMLTDLVNEESEFFGIACTPPVTGANILTDAWAFFLWLERRRFDPAWVGKPPKVPSVPKGAVA
jgi:hypothetical protein